MKLLKLVLIVLALIVLLTILFLSYMGYFSRLTVYREKMGPFTLAYESYTGPYEQSGPVFARVYQAVKAEGITSARALGIYYDDPNKVPAGKRRSDCGVVIKDKDLGKIKALESAIKVKQIPANLCLTVEFPVRNSLSYMLGPMKAYPALNSYAAANGLRGQMSYELYDQKTKTIVFVMVIGPAAP